MKVYAAEASAADFASSCYLLSSIGKDWEVRGQEYIAPHSQILSAISSFVAVDLTETQAPEKRAKTMVTFVGLMRSINQLRVVVVVSGVRDPIL